MRKRFVGCVIVLQVVLQIEGVAAIAALPRWVSSHGVESPYRPPRYVSGFGVAYEGDFQGRRDEAVEAARRQAMARLAEAVRVRVRSQLVARTTDTGTESRSRLTNVVNTSADVRLEGVAFEYDAQREAHYALAYVSVARLQSGYEEAMTGALDRFEAAEGRLNAMVARGDTLAARDAVPEAQAAVDGFAEAEAVWRALARMGRDGVVGGVGDVVGAGEARAMPTAIELGRRLAVARERIEAYVPTDERTAARFLAGQLAPAVGEVVAVRPLLYQDGDFSSAFGARFAALLRASFAASGYQTAAGGDVVVRGHYWVTDGGVVVTVSARRVADGRTVAGADVSLPLPLIADAGSLEPANAAQALSDGGALLRDAVVDGGITVEAWVGVGGRDARPTRNDEVVVAEEGEEVQFYFRVNQPAFLRLTYELATGELVLLEPAFYIDVGRVNRLVRLPYTFTVTPPFGVERLIVTASSAMPPEAATYPLVIDGQLYEVFASVGEVVGRTRGLARTRHEDADESATMLVGETNMVVTTVAR